MRFYQFAAIVLVAVSAVFASTGTSFALLSDTLYWDFTGWDHSMIVSPAGQDFDLGDGVMVNVKGKENQNTDDFKQLSQHVHRRLAGWIGK